MAIGNPDQGAALLSIRGLSIPLPAGGDREYAVRDVSFDIRAGEIVCIVGESGSGKSMSANAIMGLLPGNLRAQQGQILLHGKDLLDMDETTLRGMRGKDMAMIFQEPLSALNPLQQVGEQIAEVMRVHGAYPGPARKARVLELLDFVGLPDPAGLFHAWPFSLSGGQRQRIGIARPRQRLFPGHAAGERTIAEDAPDRMARIERGERVLEDHLDMAA